MDDPFGSLDLRNSHYVVNFDAHGCLSKCQQFEKDSVGPESLREGIKKLSVVSVYVDVTGRAFVDPLNNPDLSESFKKTIRESQKSLREFEKKNKWVFSAEPGSFDHEVG